MDDPPAPPDSRLSADLRRRRSTSWVIAGVAGVAGALAAVGGLWLLGILGQPEPVAPSPLPNVVQVVPADGESRVGTIAASATPSIVSLEIQGVRTGFETFGSGSGVVFTSDGYVLTNHHVLVGAESINVIFSDGKVFSAELIGTDPLTDLGVVKLDAAGLTPIPLGDVEAVSVGDLAVAVGNPLGLRGGPSVTSGIVSATGRRLEVVGEERLFGLIQTDAPITLGSSGGALLDEEARLIGITTAIGVTDVGAEGLGFAVPIDIVTGVAADLIAAGRVDHAYLGFEGTDHFTTTDDGASTPSGAEIRLIVPNGSIQAAGAEEGDVIVAFDGRPVAAMDQLVALLRTYRAGDEVLVSIERDGTVLDLNITLDVRPENP